VLLPEELEALFASLPQPWRLMVYGHMLLPDAWTVVPGGKPGLCPPTGVNKGYAAVGGPNQVASASVSPTSVPSPTQAT
jgi:hypothetical protein